MTDLNPVDAMTTDYRAIIQRLANELQEYIDYAPIGPPIGPCDQEQALVDEARALLAQPEPQPVAVSERLPGPEDCDAEGRCWMFGNIEGDWRLISTINSGIPKLKYCFSHWLPANALPTPESTVHD